MEAGAVEVGEAAVGDAGVISVRGTDGTPVSCLATLSSAADAVVSPTGNAVSVFNGANSASQSCDAVPAVEPGDPRDVAGGAPFEGKLFCSAGLDVPFVTDS